MNPIRKMSLTALLAILLPSGLFGQVFTQQLFSPGGSYIGVQLRDITASEVASLNLPGERGVFVVRTFEDSPAAAAGLKEGDVLLEFAQFQVFSVRQFQRLVSETPPGRRVRVSIMRQGTRQDLELTVGERQQPGVFGTAPGIRIPRFGEVPVPGGTLRGQKTNRPRLGISVQPVTSQLAESLGVAAGGGLLVMEVHEGSAAEKGGLQAGDVITSVNGQAVRDLDDLTSRLEPGVLRIELVRNRKTETLTVEIQGPVDDGDGPMRL